MKEVHIYTDGACSGNPGPGGWGVILIYGDVRKELSGFAPHTTNQRMELTAAIEALKALKYPCKVILYSDSAYLIDGFTRGWVAKWLRNGWMTTAKTPVENRELWEELLRLSKIHKIRWVKVKGHSSNEFNNRCDELARLEIRKMGRIGKGTTQEGG